MLLNKILQNFWNYDTLTLREMTESKEDEPASKLNNLINELCLSGLKKLDEDKLKHVKSICK